MIAYFAWASGPLQCLSNQSISANNKTVLLVGQIFQWRGWENKANCYIPSEKFSKKFVEVEIWDLAPVLLLFCTFSNSWY